MATSQLVTDTKKFDSMIVDVITDLRKKHKRADCESIHKETVKLADFSNTSKEDLMNRINTLLIDEKILNKRNRNLDSYYVNENTSTDNNNFSETPHNNILFDTSTDDTEPISPVNSKTPSITKEGSTSINPIPELTIGFTSPDGQSLDIDAISEKIKIQSFKDNILQNLRKNIIEIFDAELVNFKAHCEDLVKKSCADYNKIVDQLQDELKSKDHIINKLLTTIGDLTSTELKSKDNIINKLINQNNCEENTNRISMNQSSTKITSENTQDINDSDKNNTVDTRKEQVPTIKKNSRSVESNNQRSEKSKNQLSKTKPEKKSHIEIIGDSMLNGVHERGMNKDENIKVKIRKYPGASSIDILDHIKPSLRKAPEQIIIHAGTNDISNSTNYLKNVKKIVKLVKETCKDTKLSFSSVICRTDIRDITDTINTTNSHLENYCKQQNIGFINNGNIKKSDLNSKGLHLHERGSSKLAKNLLDFIY